MNLIPQFNFTDSVEGIIKNLYFKKKIYQEILILIFSDIFLIYKMDYRLSGHFSTNSNINR